MNKNTLKIVSAGGLALCIIITIGHACQNEETLDYLRVAVGLIVGAAAFVFTLATVLGAVWVGNNLLTFIFEKVKRKPLTRNGLQNQSKKGRIPLERHKDKNND